MIKRKYGNEYGFQTRAVHTCNDVASETVILNSYEAEKDFFSGNAVIECIMTNALFTKPQAARLALQGQNGIARTVRPAHSVYDKDTVFALCSGKVHALPDLVGILAMHVAEYAIWDAVKSANSYREYLSYGDRIRRLAL